MNNTGDRLLFTIPVSVPAVEPISQPVRLAIIENCEWDCEWDDNSSFLPALCFQFPTRKVMLPIEGLGCPTLIVVYFSHPISQRT